MKILSLNTHSLMEEDYEQKCRLFVKAVTEMNIDILLLQEVNQTSSKPMAESIYGLSHTPIKEDNHALTLSKLFEENGNPYYFVWLGIKNGYAIYDEGLAVMSRTPIQNTKEVLLSQKDDYKNWKTRKALTAKTGGIWVCNTHMGWWDDKEEPFKHQFEKLSGALLKYDDIILGGDFNAPDTGKAYEYVLSHGWHDTYRDAEEKHGYATVNGKIAGWEENLESIRVDYIFSKQKKIIKKSATVFDSERYGIISDHFGVVSEF